MEAHFVLYTHWITSSVAGLTFLTHDYSDKMVSSVGRSTLEVLERSTSCSVELESPRAIPD